MSQDFPLLPAYRSILANNFATVAENVNFSLPSVADNINQQVEISTRQKIKNLIPKGKQNEIRSRRILYLRAFLVFTNRYN